MLSAGINNPTSSVVRDIPKVRVAVIAHGDYFDRDRTYVLKAEDFTTDSERLGDFVENLEFTSGGDWPECYELVLRHVRKKLSVRTHVVRTHARSTYARNSSTEISALITNPRQK